MGANCGSFIAKYLLCIFNFIFFLVGTITLGVGIWAIADNKSIIALFKTMDNVHVQQFSVSFVVDQLAYVLIVAGGIMFFLSFLGYCGAMQESKCLLTTYAIFMILLLIFEITCGTLAVVFKDKTTDGAKKLLNDSIQKYYTTGEESDLVTKMWDHLMAQGSCCGVDSYLDFEKSEKWVSSRGTNIVPNACCMLTNKSMIEISDPSCPASPNDSNSYWRIGCYEQLEKLIKENQTILLGVLIGVGIIQLIAIFLAFCLCRSIEKYRGLRL